MHPSPFTRSLLAALLIGWPVIACDDPVSPPDVAGTYVLRSVRGDPLPVVLQASPQSELQVLADTLRLRIDGTGVETWILASTGPNQAGPERRELPLRFELRGHRIDVTYVCGPNENCADVISLSAQISRSELRANVHSYGTGLLVFERID